MSGSTTRERHAAPEPPTGGLTARALIRRSLRGPGGITAIGTLLAVWLLLSVDGFGSDFNRFSLGRTLAVTSLVGLSQMVVLGVGGLNLSVGAIGACVAMAAGYLLESVGLPTPLALAGAFALGAVLGALNGVLVLRLRLHSFVVTLATASVFGGTMLVLTRAEAFRNLPAGVADFGRTEPFLSVPGILVVALVIAALVALLYRRSRWGHDMLVVGANQRAARFSGRPVQASILLAHTLSGALAASAALLVVARVGAALPSTGQDWVIDSFAAPVVGGTALAGGRISVWGTLVGAAILISIRNGLLLSGTDGWWVPFLTGVVLIGALVLDRWRSLKLDGLHG